MRARAEASLSDGLPFDLCRVFGTAYELVEEGAIVNHGAAQIFSGGLSLGLAQRDFVSRAVVLRNHRMFD